MKAGIVVGFGLLAAAFAAHANEVVAVPDLRVGDKWVVQGTENVRNEVRTWKIRREVTSVEGNVATWKYEYLPPSQPRTGENRFDVTAQAILRSNLSSGKREWTRFPISPGKEWKYEFEVKTDLGIVRYELTAGAAGWEEITVPAGKFRALRIEHRGYWSRDTDLGREGVNRRLTASLEYIFWYAPEAKAMVKIRQTENSAYGGTWYSSEEQLVEVSLGVK